MAGVLATAGQWSRFQADLNRLKRHYGFTVFHAKDFRASAGEFAGWSGDRCLGLIRDLGAISSRLTEAVTCALPNEEYERYYRVGETNHRRLRLDTKYGLCFRYTTTHFILEAIRRFSHHKRFAETRLHIVLEAGHKNAGDAGRVFYEIKKEMEGLGTNLIGTLTFSGKNDGDPLMVADYLAFGTLKLEEDGRNEPGEESFAETSPRGVTGMAHLKFHAEGLATLRAQLVEGLRKGGGWKATFLEPRPPAGNLSVGGSGQ